MLNLGTEDWVPKGTQISIDIYITKFPKEKAILSLNYIVCIALWSLVTVMHNCGIQLFHGTVKYCNSHTCLCLL